MRSFLMLASAWPISFDKLNIPILRTVFGVSSDEYLNYAVSNRNEWAERGAAIVEKLLEETIANQSTASQTTGSSGSGQ